MLPTFIALAIHDCGYFISGCYSSSSSGSRRSAVVAGVVVVVVIFIVAVVLLFSTPFDGDIYIYIYIYIYVCRVYIQLACAYALSSGPGRDESGPYPPKDVGRCCGLRGLVVP